MFGYGYYPMVPAPPAVPGAPPQPVLAQSPAIVPAATHLAAPVMVIERDARHRRIDYRKKNDRHNHRHHRRNCRRHPRDGRWAIGGGAEKLLLPQPGGVGELVSQREYDKYYKKFFHDQQQQQTQQQMQYMQSYIQSLQAYIQQQQACNQNYAPRTVINAPLGGGGGGVKDGEDRHQNRLSRENKNYLVAWAREHAKKWLGPISPEVLDFYTVDKAAMRKFEVFLQNGGRKVLDMASQYLGQRFVSPRELVFAVTNLIHSQGPNYVNQLMDYLGCEFSYYLDPEDENGILAQAGKREWRRAYHAQHGQCPSLREEQERDAVLLARTAGRPSRYANPPRSIGYNQKGNARGGYDKNDAYDDDGDGGGNFVTVHTGGNKIQIRHQNGRGGISNNNGNDINGVNHQQSQLKPHLRLQFNNGGGGPRQPNMKVIADVAHNNNDNDNGRSGKRIDRQPPSLPPALAVHPPPPMLPPPTVAKSSSLGYPFAASDADGEDVSAENLFAVSLGKPGPVLCPFDD